jgi:transposase
MLRCKRRFREWDGPAVLQPCQHAKLARGHRRQRSTPCPRKLNSKVAVIGIDIGKNSFHIVGQDLRGALVLCQKWSRGQVEARLANLPPCLIGMEPAPGRIISVANFRRLATTPG